MIQFGTDGWRGIIAEDYTVDNLCLVSQAFANYLTKQAATKPVVIGYDARFMSQYFAQWVARVIAANGMQVLMADRICPSPAIAWAAKLLDTAGGIMITASHNPAPYNGIKFKTAYGGSTSPEIMAAIEGFLRELEVSGKKPELMNFDQAVREQKVTYFNPVVLHQQQIINFIDFDLVARVKGKVVFDALHGAAMGYMTSLTGAKIKLTEIRASINPDFGGVNPEPIAQNLAALVEAVNNQQAVLGLATDGDADRIGAIDADGTFINAHQIFAILIKYFIEKKAWHGEIVCTCTVSNLVEKLAEYYGLIVHRTPVGFKYICNLMLTQDIMIGGEESGGIGIRNYIPERDGIMLALLLIEAVAAYQKTLGEILQDIAEEVGDFYYHRVDMAMEKDSMVKLINFLHSGALKMIAGAEVQEMQCIDGIKFLSQDEWLMFRSSGTEPVLRIYAEAATQSRLTELLRFGEELAAGI